MLYQSDTRLEQSAVVANCRMNRERELTGSNGYEVELGFDPSDFLSDCVRTYGHASWLDLCCGCGKALIQAADRFRSDPGSRVEIVGVDLAGHFLSTGADSPLLIKAPLSQWEPPHTFDLITSVHGLHYIGDKLGLLARIVTWLNPHGRFAANLDFENFVVKGLKTSRVIASELRKAGFEYDNRRRLLTFQGMSNFALPFEYVGSDDEAGPNYTGQPAVNSHYRRAVGRQVSDATTGRRAT